MEENTMPITITVTYEDGSKEDKTVGGIFTAENGNTYAVLYDDNTRTEGTIEFVRLVPFSNNGEDDYYIENIDDDTEFDTVVRSFNEALEKELPDTDTDDNDDDDTDLYEEEIFLSNPEGVREKWILMRIFDYFTHTYAVLRREDEEEVHIVRAVIGDSKSSKFANIKVSDIEDDSEFESVKEYFLNRFG